MAAAPILCQGTTFTYNAVAINGIIGFSGLASGKAKEIDVTTLASTAKEFKIGLKDNGSFTLDMIRNGDDLGQVELLTKLAAQASASMVITLPTSTLNVATFNAYCVSLSTDVAADGVVMGKAEMRITGDITWS